MTRSQPNGPTIRLHVVNFKSKSENLASDPLFVVNGEPGAGGGVIDWVWTCEPFASVFRAERDNIYLGHRGSNFSEPAFFCPEMEADPAELIGLSYAEEVDWSMAATEACAERIISQGWNLSANNPLEAAADVADLRCALDFDEVNVYGVSYGTVLAMLMMQHLPEGVRSMILDSVGPPDVNRIDAQLTVVNDAFDALFRACAADPTATQLTQIWKRLSIQSRPASMPRTTVTMRPSGRDGLSICLIGTARLRLVPGPCHEACITP